MDRGKGFDKHTWFAIDWKTNHETASRYTFITSIPFARSLFRGEFLGMVASIFPPKPNNLLSASLLFLMVVVRFVMTLPFPLVFPEKLTELSSCRERERRRGLICDNFPNFTLG